MYGCLCLAFSYAIIQSCFRKNETYDTFDVTLDQIARKAMLYLVYGELFIYCPIYIFTSSLLIYVYNFLLK